MNRDLDALRDALRAFAAARDWQRFHAPKNLAAALSIEAAELLEHFQWMSEADSDALAPVKRAAVASEIADVLLYLVMLSDRLGVDPLQAGWDKLALNEQRYPAEKARGTSAKYDEL
jgi:NTP pyrophosphatase (non-canonical NTP hydrolase)